MDLEELDRRLQAPPTPSHPSSPQEIPVVHHTMPEQINVGGAPPEGNAFNLTPEHFDGDKTKFKSFMRQLSLAFHAAPTKFASHDSKIIFTLHHMTGGFAAEFANAFLDKWESDTPNSTTWDEFRKSLESCFGDSTSQRQAMVDIGKLTQGRLSVVEFLTKFEYLALLAGYSTDTHFQYLTTLLTNNMNEKLINSFYNTEELPTNFDGWKKHLIRLEQVWQLRRAADKPIVPPVKQAHKIVPVQSQAPLPVHHIKGSGDPMHVDLQRGVPSMQCYRCKGYGHRSDVCATPAPKPLPRAQVRATVADAAYEPEQEEDPRDAEIAKLRDELDNALKLLKEKDF